MASFYRRRKEKSARIPFNRRKQRELEAERLIEQKETKGTKTDKTSLNAFLCCSLLRFLRYLLLKTACCPYFNLRYLCSLLFKIPARPGVAIADLTVAKRRPTLTATIFAKTVPVTNWQLKGATPGPHAATLTLSSA